MQNWLRLTYNRLLTIVDHIYIYIPIVSYYQSLEIFPLIIVYRYNCVIYSDILYIPIDNWSVDIYSNHIFFHSIWLSFAAFTRESHPRPCCALPLPAPQPMVHEQTSRHLRTAPISAGKGGKWQKCPIISAANVQNIQTHCFFDIRFTQGFSKSQESGAKRTFPSRDGGAGCRCLPPGGWSLASWASSAASSFSWLKYTYKYYCL